MRCYIIAQLVCECILFFFSFTTLRDYGYLGLVAATAALAGTIVALARGCGHPKAGYMACMYANCVAIPISLAHFALTLWLLFTLEDWCCELPTTSYDSMRILLGFVAGIWLVGDVVRAWVVYQICSAKKDLYAPELPHSAQVVHGELAHTAQVVQGAPVIQAVTVVNVQSAGQPQS